MTDPSPTLDHWLGYIHPNRLGGALILLLLFLLAGKILSSLVKRAVDALIARDTDNRIDRLTARFFEQLARVFVWAFVVMIYAHAVPVLARLSTALLTSVSIASAVLGLAAQSTLANLIAGIGLIFYRPFSLGDRLQLATPAGAETGVVEQVSLGYTILRTDDDRRIIISNSTIANTTMLNLTHQRPPG